MNPLELIEEGICSGDWEQICKGYELLTGKEIAPLSNDMTIVKDAFKQISNIISTTLDDLEHEQKEIPKKKTQGLKKGKKKVKKKITTTVTADGEDISLQLDENNKTVVQKETDGTRLITNNPSSKEVADNKIAAKKVRENKDRLRRQVSKVYQVKCNECRQSFDSDRRSGQMGQKCPKCLRDKKSMFI